MYIFFKNVHPFFKSALSWPSRQRNENLLAMTKLLEDAVVGRSTCDGQGRCAACGAIIQFGPYTQAERGGVLSVIARRATAELPVVALRQLHQGAPADGLAAWLTDLDPFDPAAAALTAAPIAPSAIATDAAAASARGGKSGGGGLGGLSRGAACLVIAAHIATVNTRATDAAVFTKTGGGAGGAAKKRKAEAAGPLYRWPIKGNQNHGGHTYKCTMACYQM